MLRKDVGCIRRGYYSHKMRSKEPIMFPLSTLLRFMSLFTTKMYFMQVLYVHVIASCQEMHIHSASEFQILA